MSDYNFLMESRLSPGQLLVLNTFSRMAGDQALNFYLVGGAVRDLTYGQQVIRDLDFAVEGDPEKMLRQLTSPRSSRARSSESQTPASSRPSLELDDWHHDRRLNSAELSFQGIRAEIAACRAEVYPKPGRRPEIKPATIFDDLKRRDFSLNAMAVSLHPNSRGLLLDPTNGAADIEKRELRVLHSRSFLEDPSRIYRLIRFGLRLNFKPEEKTKRYLEVALENRVWERVDPAQQGRELRATLQEENPAAILKKYAERGLLAGLDRKLSSAKIPFERFARVRSIVRLVPGADPLLLNFDCLVEKLGSGQVSRLAKKVIAARKAVKLALSLEREARKLARALFSSRAARPSQVLKILSNQPQELLLFLLLQYTQAKIQSRVRNFLFKYPQVRARLPRAELQALGVKPGRKFEKILERVFLLQLDGKIKSRTQVTKELRALAGIKEPKPKPAKHAKPAARPKPRGKKKKK